MIASNALLAIWPPNANAVIARLLAMVSKIQADFFVVRIVRSSQIAKASKTESSA
jgi:hypothetical protein